MKRTAAARHLVALGLVALAACRPAAGPQPQAPERRTNTVEVQATEYSYSMPDRVTGGVITFEMVNIGGLPHEFAFGRLDEGTEPEDLLRALREGREPEGVQDLAGVPALGPQLNTSMTRELDPGTYVFFCFFPSPEGEPHVAHGMIKFFEVSGDSGAALPEADATVVATDEGFEVPEIGSGEQTLELRNDGQEPHEFLLFSLEPGKKERDIDRWFGSSLKGDAPAIFPGGMQSIEPGSSVFVTVEFEAGRTYQFRDFESGLRAEFTPA
jgi:hypothetical protein